MVLYYTNKYTQRRGESRELLQKAFSLYTGSELVGKNLVESIIIRGKNGKPAIEEFDEFSVSHSEEVWAVLIGNNICGLDVQYEKCVQYLKLAKRFYNEDEEKSVQEKGIEEFFRIWTRREALIKALGASVISTDIPSVLGKDVKIDGHTYYLSNIENPITEGKKIYIAVCIRDSIQNIK